MNFYAEEGSANASLQIARAYNAIGNLEKAITQYKSVVEKNPDFQIALSNWENYSSRPKHMMRRENFLRNSSE